VARLPKSTLAELEKLLTAEIPKAVKAAQIKEPVYCARVWYNGTDSPEDAVPWVMVVKESARQEFLTKHGNDQAPFYVWGADEISYPEQAYAVHLENERLGPLYAKWYEYLCDAEDDEELQPFREMVQRVSRTLNDLDWNKVAKVTDDFVVVPADGSHTFCDDLGDLLASVSDEQLELLQSRNLIPDMDQDFDDEDEDDDDETINDFDEDDDEDDDD